LFLVKINREEIKDFVPEKMLNKHYGSSYVSHPYDSNYILQEHITNNISLPKFEWQTLLSIDHWSTLFSYYNISCDNRYLTIMPSIYLPTVSSEDQRFDKHSQHKVNLFYLSMTPSSGTQKEYELSLTETEGPFFSLALTILVGRVCQIQPFWTRTQIWV
jgi:hypothetical protein